MRTKFELAQVLERFGKSLLEHHKISPVQTKTLLNILQCRTADLGGHQEVCDSCGVIRYSYNSCGNRNCPKCLAAKQMIWVEQLIEKTLPINHFHIVFTVPHSLNKICLWDNALYYNVLFRAAWQTLNSFGYSQYGLQIGAVAVLHTWGQNLTLHPHLHCLVPAAGYDLKGKWKTAGMRQKYLFSVQQLSDTFKGKFLDYMKRELRKKNVLDAFSDDIQSAYRTDWVVHSQPSLAKAEHVIRYLGQYTHRVAISNDRILNISKSQVSFMAKDYNDGAKKKVISLDGVEFLRRFCLHILPQNFVKIRYFGIYNPSYKSAHQLQFVPQTIDIIEKKQNPKETALQVIFRVTGWDACKCPYCKTGKMITTNAMPRIRSPSQNMPKLLSDKLL